MRAVTLLAALLAACASTATDDDSASAAPCVKDPDGAYPTWGTFGRAFFLDYCESCHARSTPQRFGAPATVHFDTEEDVVAQRAAVRRAVIEAGTMPRGGGVPEEDLAALERYLDCLENPP
jgi:hypothetical protein